MIDLEMNRNTTIFFVIIVVLVVSGILIWSSFDLGAYLLFAIAAILAVICYSCENNIDTYGYTIWQTLKDVFHIYINNDDVRNVYHHLNDLCQLGYIQRRDDAECLTDNRCLYRITENGKAQLARYEHYNRVLAKSL